MTTVIHFSSSLLDDGRAFEYVYRRGWHSRFARELAKRDRTLRFQCWVPATIKRERLEEVDDIVYRAFPARRAFPPSYRRILRSLSEVAAREDVGFHIHDFRTATALYMIAMIPPGVPIFVQDHGFIKGKSMLTLADALLLRRPQRIDVISKYAVSYLLKIGLNSARVRLKTMGVDFGLFKPLPRESAREKLGLPQDVPLVLYVNRFTEWKGLRKVVNAVEKLKTKKDVKLVAVGGRLGDDLYDYAKQKCDWAFPRVPIEHMPWFYSACNATTQFYEERENGLGVNLMESMACGTPVVSNTLIHLRSMSEINEVGRIADSEDSLAEAIEDALEGDFDRSKCRETSYKYFSWDSIAEQTLEDYRAAFQH